MTKCFLVLANQLDPNSSMIRQIKDGDELVMIEADDISRKFPYHTHKLVLLFSAMRHFHDDMKKKGISTNYYKHQNGQDFIPTLTRFLEKKKCTEFHYILPTDRNARQALKKLSSTLNVTAVTYSPSIFITDEDEIFETLKNQKSTLLETYYRTRRKKTGILMEFDEPVGSKWNFDHENRKPLPTSGVSVPALRSVRHDEITKEVIAHVAKEFAENPGKPEDFWLPVTHGQSQAWLDDFIDNRLQNFGAYEDAMRKGEPFVFHSVMSPLLNIGLVSPAKAINAAIAAYENNDAPIAAVEGFVRQILGWREYMYAMYWLSPKLAKNNYFGFKKQLEDWWYTGDFASQKLPAPLHDVLERTHHYGYVHHIERLMVLGNWFLLNQYDPHSVNRWFMSMYVDAYDWVMLPNVIGMSQYADGGKIATKPYISGGNYLQKMGRWWETAKAAKESEYTTLYWKFLHDNHKKLEGNQRMSLVLKQAAKRYDQSDT